MSFKLSSGIDVGIDPDRSYLWIANPNSAAGDEGYIQLTQVEYEELFDRLGYVKVQPGVTTTTALGVWAHITRDHYERISSVHATEVEALRECVRAGGGRVAFVNFGDASAWRQ